MRLLVFGHMSDTGFGIVTKRVGEELVKRGIDVRILAENHRGEPVKGPLAGRVYPIRMMSDIFANWSGQAIAGSLWTNLDRDDHWKPDQVLCIADMSGFMSYVGQRMTTPWLSVPVWHYCPIEGDNLNPSWADIWNNPGNQQFPDAEFRPVAMTDYGAKVIGDLTGREVPRVYHGVDTDVFRPVSAAEPLEYEGKVLRTKDQCKSALGLRTDRRYVLRIDRLVARKRYDLQLRTMTAVFEQVPDVDMIMHCSPIDPPLNLLEELARMPRHLWGRAMTTDSHDTFRGMPTAGVVVLMNAADLYVSTTAGEGFGLTLAESIACGVPVVTTDWAAGPEVVGPGGIVVPPLHDAYGEVVRDHAHYGMDWAYPDWRGFVEPITTLLAKPHRRTAMGEAGRRHVQQSFSWSTAADQFVALFDSVVPAEVAA